MAYSPPSQNCPIPKVPGAPRANRIVRQNRREISSSFDEELQPRRRLFFQLEDEPVEDEKNPDEDPDDLVISDEDLELKMNPTLLNDEVAMYDKENRYWLNRDCSTFVAVGTPSSVPVTECLDHHAFIEMQNGVSKEDYENSWVYDSDLQILVPRELYMSFSPKIVSDKPQDSEIISEDAEDDDDNQGLGFLNIFNIGKFF